ncbi:MULTISPECIES: hypothetical protein [Arthrobacter]|uniref:Uncharacterized protein n=1 Tax=Arthrobacter oryzae TaxID=409290 RepID=A0A3N0CLW5_9MICC|nr:MULTISPECIES: hypothetical protein [Arthrobacter]QYF90293.1 hypothetical protein KY499_02885 [Arthrobacter sp. PAMC25284]RNL63883.1 hypothetical protein D7003_00445 [Arthrobacter oryzae]
MPWWSWILIWIALVSLSLLFFVVLGVRLFRQFMTTVKELGEAGDRFSRPAHVPVSGPAADAPVSAGEVHGAGQDVIKPAPGTAVFALPEQMRHDYRASKQARREDRRLRRIQRKRDRGQPQSLRDTDFS